MTKRKHLSAFELTDSDSEFLQKISAGATPAFIRSMSIFLTACQSKGYENKVAAAAFAFFALSSLAKLLALSSKVPADEIDSETMGDIAQKTQATLAMLVSEYIDNGNARDAAEFN